MNIKTILLCSSRLALPALQELAFVNMLAAVVIPQHRDEMVEHVQFVLAGSAIPIVTVNKGSYVHEIQKLIKQFTPCVGLIVTFSFKIPASVYTLPTNGFYNIHPGALPEYRGADPIFWQLKNGEKQAGVTLHQLDDDFDTGPVIIKEMLPLHSTDTYGMLTTKLSQLCAKLTIILMRLISLGHGIPSRPQDASRAQYFKRQNARDVTISWELMEGSVILALINACNPWNKGAITKINNTIVRLLEAELAPDSITAETWVPGTIVGFDQKSMSVTTLDRQLIIVHLVYVEEGFISAARLQQLGISTGNRFQTV